MFGLMAVYVTQHIVVISISVLLAYIGMRIWQGVYDFLN